MESGPSKKSLKGLKKVPQFQDLLKVELANAHKYLYLPERYVFTASHAAEASDDFEKALADFKSRHLSAMDDHHNGRRGDNPVIVTQAQDAPRAPASDPRPAAAPPPPPDTPMLSKRWAEGSVSKTESDRTLETGKYRMNCLE